MGSVLHVRLLTPDRLLLETEVAEVVAPGSLGELGILPNHMNLASSLRPGRLALRDASGGAKVVAVFGGYLEVAEDTVTILADGAEMAERIDAPRAEQDLKAAEGELTQLEPGSSSYNKASARAARARARLAAASAGR